MRHVPPGWTQVEAIYACKMCERREVIHLTQGEEQDLGPLDNWRTFDASMGGIYDLCSSDCERARDIIFRQAYANLEPVPQHRYEQPKGLMDEFHRLRREWLRDRR